MPGAMKVEIDHEVRVLKQAKSTYVNLLDSSCMLAVLASPAVEAVVDFEELALGGEEANHPLGIIYHGDEVGKTLMTMEGTMVTPVMATPMSKRTSSSEQGGRMWPIGRLRTYQ